MQKTKSRNYKEQHKRKQEQKQKNLNLPQVIPSASDPRITVGSRLVEN